MQPTRPTLITLNITISGLKHMKGTVVSLTVLRPGIANITVETLEVLPYGVHEASYKTPGEEITGALKVTKVEAYQNRWRASGIFTRRWRRRRGIILE